MVRWESDTLSLLGLPPLAGIRWEIPAIYISLSQRAILYTGDAPGENMDGREDPSSTSELPRDQQ